MHTAERLALIREAAERRRPCKHGQRTDECAACRPADPEPEPPAPEQPAEPPPPPPQSARDHLLAAARELTAAGPFAPTALIIAAWQRAPNLFGLSGATTQHPDARKVAVQLFGKKGLLASGDLARMPDGRLYVPRCR